LIKEIIDAAGAKVVEADVQAIPKLQIDCNDEAKQANLDLIEWLEEIDDVVEVFHNMNI